jgi:hypothetical protein
MRGASTSNFHSLAVYRAREKKGERRERAEAIYRLLNMKMGLGFMVRLTIGGLGELPCPGQTPTRA